jgi:hypothetical protein
VECLRDGVVACRDKTIWVVQCVYMCVCARVRAFTRAKQICGERGGVLEGWGSSLFARECVCM